VKPKKGNECSPYFCWVKWVWDQPKVPSYRISHQNARCLWMFILPTQWSIDSEKSLVYRMMKTHCFHTVVKIHFVMVARSLMVENTVKSPCFGGWNPLLNKMMVRSKFFGRTLRSLVVVFEITYNKIIAVSPTIFITPCLLSIR
jgi:hypothetical protein